MYYITKKTSETGKKITAVLNRAKEAQDATSAFVKAYGCQNYAHNPLNIYGGVSGLVFEEEPDLKAWKQDANNPKLYTPRLNTKAGKDIKAAMKALPGITKTEFNACIGFKSHTFAHFGLNVNNKTHYCIIIKEEWNLTMPKDCHEITIARYKQWFG